MQTALYLRTKPATFCRLTGLSVVAFDKLLARLEVDAAVRTVMHSTGLRLAAALTVGMVALLLTRCDLSNNTGKIEGKLVIVTIDGDSMTLRDTGGTMQLSRVK